MTASDVENTNSSLPYTQAFSARMLADVELTMLDLADKIRADMCTRPAEPPIPTRAEVAELRAEIDALKHILHSIVRVATEYAQ